MPLDLLRAISHANKILDWHENLVTDEIPPEWMWPFDDPLNEWFDDIKRDRAMANSGTQTVDDRTEVPMMSNELAEGRGR